MKFRTGIEIEKTHKRYYMVNGNPIKTEFALRLVDGNYKLVRVGSSSLYDSIQSHADSVDIHKILERCALANDYSVLNRMPAEFMDVTNMPKTLAEAHAMIQDAKNYFDKMPIEIKEKFDNSYLEFIQSIGTKKFESIAGEFLNKVKPDDIAGSDPGQEQKEEVKE